MTKKLLTILVLTCALATTGCEHWWHHDHGGYDRGGEHGEHH